MATNDRLLWTVSFYHLCNDGTLMAIVALLPILVDEMGISVSEVGLLGSGLVVTLVVQYGVGRVADRESSKMLLELGAAVLTLSLFLIIMVNDFVGLFSAMIVMRIGAAFYHPVGSAWVTRAYCGPGLDRALGVQSGIGNLGIIIAWVTSGYLGQSFGWKVPCVLWVAFNLAAVASGSIFLKDVNARPTAFRKADRIRSHVTLWKIGILAVPIVAGEAMYQITSYFGPLNLTEGGKWSAGNADLMFAFWTAVGTVTAYFFGALSARFGRRRLLMTGLVVSGAGVLLLSAVSEWYVVGAILAAYGALLYLTYPVLVALVSDATEEKERGTAFGILYGLQLVSGSVTILACGWLSETLGDPGYSLIVASGFAVAGVLALLVWEKKIGQERPNSAG